MHTHLQDYKTNCATDIIAQAKCKGLKHIVCAAAKETDWENIKNLHEKNSSLIVPAFGIHPWYVGTILPAWEERLEKYLKSFSTAFVGESGIDGYKENIETQIKVFETHIELAQKYHRPLVIHSVKAVDIMAKYWDKLPPVFMVHSFNGHPEHLKPIIKNGGYVSFSASILKNKKAQEIVTSVPYNKILAETDSPYQGIEKGKEQTPFFVPEIIRQIALWRNQNQEELAHQIYQNSEEFIYANK